MHALDQINQGGTIYEIVPEIAELFKTTKAYHTGDHVIYEAGWYTFKADKSAGAWDATKVDGPFKVTEQISNLKEDLSQKANTDGYYEDLVSGGSTQLLSNMVETDTVPYNYRTAGGALEIGDRMKLKEVVGASAVVNQLALTTRSGNTDSGVTLTADGDGVYTLTGTSTGTPLWRIISGSYTPIANHVYLHSLKSTGVNVKLFRNGYTSTKVNNGSIITKFTESTVFSLLVDTVGVTVNETVIPQIFDLTLMLGSTIADYVYTLESGTAGTGVAWLKKYFPKIFDAGYIPYNAGGMEHVSGLSAHKMTGFNQWDEEWEVGAYTSASGSKVASNDRIRCKNMIHVLPNTTYYFKAPYTNVQMYYYGANGEYLRWVTPPVNRVITIPADTYFITFNGPANSGTTYNHDICINLHWDGERDGEYEPYEEHSYPLDSNVELRGLFKFDSNNDLYADGDVYNADGTVMRKYGIVDLGTLGWTYRNNNVFSADQPSDAKFGLNENGNPNGVCSKYRVVGQKSVAELNDKEIEYGRRAWVGDVIVKDSAYTDAATFKTAMSGVYLVYELATPTTEEGTPYTEEQITNNWGTEELVSTTLVPVGHVTDYHPDLRAKTEVAPESPDTDGLYLMKRENGENSYVAYLGELPSDPSEDGTYTLKCTVASGVATKTWEADE